MSDNKNIHDMTEEDIIDSVKNVDIKIRDYRADDDFEQMLAQLNSRNKPKEPAPAKSETKPAKPAESARSAKPVEPAEPAEPANPAGADKPVQHKQPPKKRPAGQKPAGKKRPAGQADQTGRSGQKKPAPANANVKKPANGAKPAKSAPPKQAKKPEKQPAKAPEKEPEQPLIPNLEEIWKNPNLADGGRVAMNIKTDLRKEIKITIPKELAEKPKQKPAPAKSDKSEKAVNADKSADSAKSGKAEKPAAAENVPAASSELAAQLKAAKMAKTAQSAKSAQSAGSAKSAPKKAAEKAVPAMAAATLPMDAGISGRSAKSERSSKSGKKRKAPAQTAPMTMTMTKREIAHKQFAIVNVIVCFAIFFGLGFFLLVCQRESGFIQSENRNLAEKPKLTVQALLDGSYFTDISKWYTDTVPGREELKPVSSNFSKLFGITLHDVKIKGDLAPAVKEELDEAQTRKTEEVTINTDFSNTQTTAKKKKKKKTSEKLAEVPENLDDGEWMGNVVVSGKGKNVRAMSAFYGTFDMGKKYAETINKYRDDLTDQINMYTMNMPTSAAYYMPSNLADQFTSQHDCIKNIGNNLNGIVNVDVYSTLDEHKSEYIYSRTDHHWAPLGAYYAAKVFAEKSKVDFPDLKTYEECKIEDFVGTMYAYSDYDEELANNPDTFIYYKPDNNYTVTYYDTAFQNAQTGASLFFDYASGVNCYSAILGRDDVIAELDTDCTNGRTLVIFKDSFGNALVPFLTHSFSKIYICDFRYFDLNAIDFIENVGATDVLFAVSIAAAHTESHINAIGNDRIQTDSTASADTDADANGNANGLPEEYIPGDDTQGGSDGDDGTGNGDTNNGNDYGGQQW